MSPILLSVDLMGVEPITPILQGSVASIGMQAQFANYLYRNLDIFNHRFMR